MSSAARPADEGVQPIEPADLGVLLVHGIGFQRRGDTLQAFGGALEKWLEARAGTAPGEFSIRVTDALAEEAGVATRGSGPTVAELELTRTSQGSATTRWVLAESWWGDDFRPPRMRDIFTWGLQIIPWTVTTHFWTLHQQSFAATLWPGLGPKIFAALRALVWDPLTLFLAVLLAPALLVVLLLLTLLAFIPVNRIRSFVLKVQSWLTASIGDSFIFLEEPIQRAAILARVRRDYRALRNRSRVVAVVAHSQGAAIAHRLVQECDEVRPSLLMTFGSGVNKLVRLAELRTDRGNRRARWMPVAAAVGVALVGVVAWVDFFSVFGAGWRWWHAASLVLTFGFVCLTLSSAHLGWRDTTMVSPKVAPLAKRWTLVLAILTLASLVILYTSPTVSIASLSVLVLGLSLFARGIWESEARIDERKFTLPREVRWVDLYTRLDPVPNGPPPWSIDVRPIEVANRGSVLRDHNTYPANRDSFLSEVASELARVGGAGWLAIDDDRRRKVTLRRIWRAGWLRAARAVLVASLGAVLLSGGAVLASIGGGVQGGSLGRGLVGTLGLMAEWLSGLPGLDRSPGPPADALVGSAFVVLGGVAAYMLVLGIWAIWDSVEQHRFERGAGFRGLEAPFVALCLVLAAAITIGVFSLGGLLADVDREPLVAALLAGSAIVALWSFVDAVHSRLEGPSKSAPPGRPVLKHLQTVMIKLLIITMLSLPVFVVASSTAESWNRMIEGLPDAVRHPIGALFTGAVLLLLLCAVSPGTSALRACWRRWSHSE